MDKNSFPWGKVTRVHSIGDHHITEYIVGPKWDNAGYTEYSVCESSFDTLDEALIYSICVGNGDQDAARYIMKILRSEEL